MKKLFIILILFSSCAGARLHKSGIYTIDTREGNATTFKEVRGRYILLSDTLKPGDKVEMLEVKSLQ